MLQKQARNLSHQGAHARGNTGIWHVIWQQCTCTFKMVNPVGPSNKRALTEVLISGVNITVLPDSGVTVSAMDEATFRRSGLEKRVNEKNKCQIKPYGAHTETKTLPVLGSFEALTESKTRIELVTWQLIKGDTQTPPLLGYTVGKISESYESPTQLLQRKTSKCQQQTKQKDWCKNTQIGWKGLAKWKGYGWVWKLTPISRQSHSLPGGNRSA